MKTFIKKQFKYLLICTVVRKNLVLVLKQHTRNVRATGGKVPPALISRLKPWEKSV